MQKLFLSLLFILSAIVTATAAAEDCNFQTGVCYGVNWKTATPSDIAGINAKAVTQADGYTPLHWAALYSKNPAVITALLQAGAAVNADSRGGTPLHRAARYNESAEVMRALLQAGADANAFFREELTPLHIAASGNKNPAIIKALINAGGEVNARGKVTRATPLFLAARYNNLPALKALLKAGADVNARRDSGSTPLDWAVAENNELQPEIVAALINAGAKVNGDDDGNASPLHWVALENENPAVIKVLVNAGAKVNAKTSAGNTPLHWAAVRNNNPAVAETLIEAGAQVNAVNETDDTSTIGRMLTKWLAKFYGETHGGDEEFFIQMLLQQNATPLHFAAWKNQNPAVIKALLKAGADAAAKNRDGETPYSLIQKNEHLKKHPVIQTLYKKTGGGG